MHLGLLEMQLHQFVDLQDLAERDEQAVLLQRAVAQEDFAAAANRVAVGGLTLGIERTLQPARDHPWRTTGVRQ